MSKAIAISKSAKDDARYEAELGVVLREIDRRLRQMKKTDTEIERLRRKTRATLDRLKVM